MRTHTCFASFLFALVLTAGILTTAHASPSIRTFPGDVTLSHSIKIEIEGTSATAPVEFDQLIVTGNLAFDGKLKLELKTDDDDDDDDDGDDDDDNSFTPAYGDTFTIISYGSRTGDFDRVIGSVLRKDLALAPVYDFLGSSDPLFANTPFGASPNSLTLFTTVPGDANLDLAVDDADLSLLLTNFGKKDTSWANGDFTGNGKVNDADLSLLLTNFGTTVTIPSNSGLTGQVSSIPEPATLTLLSLGCLLLARRRTA